MKRLTAIVLSFAAVSTVSAQAPKVGPAHGSVMVVGGGAIGKDVFQKFIELAGGPDALIIDVPTAGGNATYGAKTSTSRQIEAAGAKNVLVLHTVDRKIADADSFVASIQKAGGIWFEGGRQWHLVDSYAGTKSETAFREVLGRGGVIGGTSAGASILASFLLRGAREGNTVVVAPEYLAGFGYLRETAIDQHVVARSRLRDLADSLVPRYPKLLGISEDEGTVWLVQGDSSLIMGRNKAFAYNGNGNDPGRPFVTLHPGDKYDLANRRVISRAIDNTPITESFVDETVRRAIGSAQAAIVVAQNGKVLVDRSWNIPEDSTGQGASRHATYMPTTTLPQFPVGDLSKALLSVPSQNAALEGKAGLADSIARGHVANNVLTRSLYTPIGMHQTRYDASTGEFRSDVDELYRFELGLEDSGMFVSDSAEAKGARSLDTSIGWIADTFKGAKRLAQFGTPDGKRAAFMRFPDRGITVILLTDGAAVDAKGVAEKIAEKLLK